MKIFLAAALLAALTFAPAALAQHGHSGQSQHQQHSQPQHQQHTQHAHGSFGREHPTHFRRGDYRYFHGHQAYFFGGYWWGCGMWPDWFFDGDVFFLVGDDGEWYAYSIGHPGLFIRVVRY